MNNLSILIYLSGVTGNLGNFLTFVAVVFGILGVVSLIVWLVHHDETNSAYVRLDGDALAGVRDKRKTAWRWFWCFCGLMVFTGSLASLVPSRQTVLLIAASEMGERVLNHPRVNQVIDPGIDLLTTWMEKEKHELQKSMQQGKK
tara:strand:- start:943 stop:1377 length:435 start_codon:yes stop_codon:yes gene_type:complete